MHAQTGPQKITFCMKIHVGELRLNPLYKHFQYLKEVAVSVDQEESNDIRHIILTCHSEVKEPLG